MTDAGESERAEREPNIGEIADLAIRRVTAAIVIAGVAIALAIYSRPAPPRYQAFATETGIVRIDTRKGTVIGCEAGRCMTLLKSGQRLAPNPNVKSRTTISLPKQ